MKKALLATTAALAAATALAYAYGRWLCTDCSFPPAGSARSAYAPPEAVIFIKTNNDLIMQSGPTADKVHQWITYDTIDICDGENCLALLYRFGMWFPMGPVYKDPKQYKNAPQPSSSSSGGEGGSIAASYSYYGGYYYSSPAFGYSGSIDVGPLTLGGSGLYSVREY